MCTTHGHELRGGDMLEGGGYRLEGRTKGRKFGTTVIAQSINYTKKKKLLSVNSGRVSFPVLSI